MKVILNQDIKGLGRSGDMVNVADGYGRNFLIPRGMAVEADSKNMNIMMSKRKAQKEHTERETERAKRIAEKLSKTRLLIKAKSGERGRLFGSITSRDLADEIKKQFGVEVDRKKIDLPEPIKAVGLYKVEIKLYAEINVTVDVEVTSE